MAGHDVVVKQIGPSGRESRSHQDKVRTGRWQGLTGSCHRVAAPARNSNPEPCRAIFEMLPGKLKAGSPRSYVLCGVAGHVEAGFGVRALLFAYLPVKRPRPGLLIAECPARLLSCWSYRACVKTIARPVCGAVSCFLPTVRTSRSTLMIVTTSSALPIRSQRRRSQPGQREQRA